MLRGRRGRAHAAGLEARAAALQDRVAELEARLDHERLFPLEWVNRRVRDRFAEAVVSGPFEGMRYPDHAFERVDLYAPKLLGAYEREIAPALERAIARGPAAAVVIGAAEGYYAIGLARRLPEAIVVAYEADDSKVELLDPERVPALRGAPMAGWRSSRAEPAQPRRETVPQSQQNSPICGSPA